jgi:hypothetical protein
MMIPAAMRTKYMEEDSTGEEEEGLGQETEESSLYQAGRISFSYRLLRKKWQIFSSIRCGGIRRTMEFQSHGPCRMGAVLQ